MISVIVCSADTGRVAALKKMYGRAMGDEPWEMIAIEDARSPAEGNNRGVAASRGEMVVFSGDDVEVLSPDFPGKLRQRLAEFDLVGVAGSRRVMNGAWTSAGPPHLVGQVARLGQENRIVVDLYGAPRRSVGGMMALDGVFMAARREALEKISFDAANFDGFHLYETDFCLQAHQAGFALGVACDIHLLRRAAADYGPVWEVHTRRFAEKWRRSLVEGKPPMCQWMNVFVSSRREALQVMNPPYWEYDL